MREEFDFSHGDAVIERGYAIYEEWKTKNISSRKIVKSVEGAVSLMNGDETGRVSAEALSYLFALEMRVKERYKGVMQRLFKYFSWRRETGALKRLKVNFNISDNADIRDAIEVALKNIRERIKAKDFEAADKGSRGGKNNEMSDKEIENKISEDSPEKENDRAEEHSADERSKEKTESKNEQYAQTDANEKIGEEKQFDNTTRTDTQKGDNTPARERISQSDKKETNNLRNENNGANIFFEPSRNTTKENKTYNAAEDFPPPPDFFESEKPQKLSFIDEVIIDNMIKGESDIIGHNPLEDVRSEPSENINRESIIINADHSADKDRDAHLYDKVVLEKNGILQVDFKENEDVRFSIQVDTDTQSIDNIVRGEITGSFSEKDILERKAFQEAEFRRQFSIDMQDMGKESKFETSRGDRSNSSNVKSINKRK